MNSISLHVHISVPPASLCFTVIFMSKNDAHFFNVCQEIMVTTQGKLAVVSHWGEIVPVNTTVWGNKFTRGITCLLENWIVDFQDQFYLVSAHNINRDSKISCGNQQNMQSTTTKKFVD